MEKGRLRLSQTRTEKNAKRARKCKKKRKQAFEENRTTISKENRYFAITTLMTQKNHLSYQIKN